MSDFVEARLAGAEGVGAVGDAVRLVTVAALRPVAPAVVQLGVCAQSEAMAAGESTDTLRNELGLPIGSLWKLPVLHPISSEPKSSQSLKKLQRSVELMHLWLAHWNSSFSQVGVAERVAGGRKQRYR